MEATAACFYSRAPIFSMSLGGILMILSCLVCRCLASSSSSHVAANSHPLLDSTDDRQALLDFKFVVAQDPLGPLRSWNESLGHFCSWRGVTCGGRRHPQRVTSLELESLGLAGPIPTSLANLTFLRRIHLFDNQFHGNIPPDLGRLFRLQHLNLSSNYLSGGIPASLAVLGRTVTTLDLSWNNLTGGIPPWLGNFTSLTHLRLSNNALGGTIPASLSHLFSLQMLHLSMNSLEGGIPSALGNLFSLEDLQLANNSLSGIIPPSFGNLSSLQYLRLSRNQLEGDIPLSLGHIPLEALDVSFNKLSGGIPLSIGNLSSSLSQVSFTSNLLVGPIPTTVGNLARLSLFTAALNQLEGTIPPSLYNLSFLNTLDVGGNQLSGTLPVNIGSTLPRLEILSLRDNQLHGHIPSSLSNASGLHDIELDTNNFTGTVPVSFGTLKGLHWFTIYSNQLEAKDAKDWSFLTSLSNCSRLKALGLHENNFGGVLPNSISNLSKVLDQLTIYSNHISGSIPEGIGELTNLTVLSMGYNLFEGPIPQSIAKLRKLEGLDLSGNMLSMQIPSSFSNLTQLNTLYLYDNSLQGAIPPSLGDLKGLQELDLSYNKLSGLIPKEIVSIQFLSRVLDLSHNSLTGPLPPEIGSLQNINLIDVSNNKLSGGIPSTLGQCEILENLYMQGNALNGSIPQDFKDLRGISRIDLSRNNLSGGIPKFLADLKSLEYLNLSFNKLQGEVPRGGIFRNASAVFLVGNHKLCGGNVRLFHLPACPPQVPAKRSHHSILLKVIIPVLGVVFCLLTLLFLYLVFTRRSRRKTPPTTPSMELVGRVTYSDLFKATDGFSSRNLIGVGSFGSVYKANMDPNDPSGKLVAVKVMNLQQGGASKSFLAECKALRNIRHRNLLKILTSCSSIDHSGNDFKALMFEYMPNGSLEKWLHPAKHESIDEQVNSTLSLRQRLNIAIDVASALSYLHRHSHHPIVDCDLKPSNVLLDENMTAHVGDFGLARFLATDASRSSASPSGSSVVRGTIGYAAPEYGMGCNVSTQGDAYSYGILLLEMITGLRPTDSTFQDELTLRKFVETSFPEQVLEVVDEKLLSEESDSADREVFQNAISPANERTIQCLVSMIRVGLLCSNESPRERMEMEEVVKELIATRSAYLG